MKTVANFDRIGEENAFAVLARANALAAQGRDIINLGIGQPDFRTPDHIAEAAIKAIRDGHHGYTAATGIPILREAVAADLHKRFGAQVSPDEVMIMPGGKPLVSVPPFIVITFEGTILWASMFTFVGMLLLTKLPARDLPKEVEDPRFSNDHFGIVLENLDEAGAAKAKSILHHSGAIEVTGGGEGAAHGAHHA